MASATVCAGAVSADAAGAAPGFFFGGDGSVSLGSRASAFAAALPSRDYSLPWPQVWEGGAEVALAAFCDGSEFERAKLFLSQRFEDVELHQSPGAYVAFLGAVLEPPPFGREGPLSLAVLPGLPGSLQVALTLLGLGLLDASHLGQATGPQAAADAAGVTRLPLTGLSLGVFVAPNFVALARRRLGLGGAADLAAVSQEDLESAILWQSADELRRFQHHDACSAEPALEEHRGALLNLLHGYATNYYHFVTEQVPALIALQAELAWLPSERVKVLYLGQAWQAEYARLAGFSPEQLLPYDACSVYRADHVYTAAVPDSKSAELLLQTRALLPGARASNTAFAPIRGGDSPEVPRCFKGDGAKPRLHVLVLERRCGEGAAAACVRGRSIENHGAVLKQVQDALLDKGAAICNLRAEQHSVADQARHFEVADLLVGAIGAGLTNILYMRPGGVVVALHPAHPDALFSVYSSHCGQSYFWHMASQLGLVYFSLFCPELTVFEGGRAPVRDLRKLLLSPQVRDALHRRAADA